MLIIQRIFSNYSETAPNPNNGLRLDFQPVPWPTRQPKSKNEPARHVAQFS